MMENKKAKSLNGLTGILGLGAIILSIILFTYENAGEVFKSVTTALFQVDIGLLLIVYGIREKRTKGKTNGNNYLYVGAAVVLSTAYTLYGLFMKLGQ